MCLCWLGSITTLKTMNVTVTIKLNEALSNLDLQYVYMYVSVCTSPFECASLAEQHSRPFNGNP